MTDKASNTLVNRLRFYEGAYETPFSALDIMDEAANRIEFLEKELDSFQKFGNEWIKMDYS